jgi:hypothetical protein
MRRWIILVLALCNPFSTTIATPTGLAFLESVDYQQWNQGRITVFGLESDFRTARNVIATLKRALPEIEKHLPDPGEVEVRVVIAPTEKEFDRITGGQIPEWGIGAADVSRSLLVLKSPRIAEPEVQIDRIVIHELCHVLLGQALRPHTADRWFDEGFAQYTSGELRLGASVRLARSLVTRQFINLEDIDDVLSFQQDKAALAYAESRAAVAYLIESYGSDVIARITSSLGRGNNMDSALRAAIGIGFDAFEAQWIRALKKRTRWIILLDTPILVSVCLLALFFAAFINARRKIRLKTSEPEVGWDEFGQEKDNPPSV